MRRLDPLKDVLHKNASINLRSATAKEILATQRALNRANSPTTDQESWKFPKIPETGVYGKWTANGVKNIQGRHAIEQKEKIDKNTLLAIMIELRGGRAPEKKAGTGNNASNLAVNQQTKKNIDLYVPIIERTMKEKGLNDPRLLKYVVATIAAECSTFAPQSERASYLSTKDKKRDGSYDFSGYEGRKDLGNTQPGDGARFKGRGFVQITGRYNYESYGRRLGYDLVKNPEMANYPKVATEILVTYIADKKGQIINALDRGDLKAARRAVNGGHNGMNNFLRAWDKLN